jgi:hypothetical protein
VGGRGLLILSHTGQETGRRWLWFFSFRLYFLLSIPLARKAYVTLFLVCSRLSFWTFPDGPISYARPPPPPPPHEQHTNPLSVLSADRSHSLYVTPIVVPSPYRTLHLLSPTSPLFSVLIPFGRPFAIFRVKKTNIRDPSTVYSTSWAGVVLPYPPLLFVSSRSLISLHSY